MLDAAARLEAADVAISSEELCSSASTDEGRGVTIDGAAARVAVNGNGGSATPADAAGVGAVTVATPAAGGRVGSCGAVVPPAAATRLLGARAGAAVGGVAVVLVDGPIVLRMSAAVAAVTRGKGAAAGVACDPPAAWGTCLRAVGEAGACTGCSCPAAALDVVVAPDGLVGPALEADELTGRLFLLVLLVLV